MVDRPKRLRESDLTSEQRAKLAAFRARNRTPEARAEEARIRDLVRVEFPPAHPDDELLGALAALRIERERQGLSLTDLAELTGIDRATISKLENGKAPNSTVATLRTIAQALGKRLTWRLEGGAGS